MYDALNAMVQNKVLSIISVKNGAAGILTRLLILTGAKGQGLSIVSFFKTFL